MTDEQRRASTSAADVATGLDALLPDAPRRGVPAAAGLRLAAALATRPLTVARRGAGLAGELTRLWLGRSATAPDPGDARYADPAWSNNPVLRRLVQSHLAACATTHGLVSDARLGGRDDERLHSAIDTVAAALAPSNTPLNPEAWRAAIDTGGASAVRGTRRLVTDLATPPRVPSTTEPDAFEVGTDVAATPGAVVLRTPVFELIQYLPQTEAVRDVPLVVVPPVLNRYYVADLSPGRSIVEHLVRAGQQVFALSWRNPDVAHACWDLDTYGRAVLDGLAAAEHVARTRQASLMALGSGATITAMVLAHLAAGGEQERVASMTLAGAVLDRARAGDDRDAALAAVATSGRTGYLDGRPLLEELAWRAPDQLIWPYWVRSYLRGEPPAASDVLFWDSDATRVPAGLHRDLVDVALRNALATPGAATMLGTPVELAKVDRDCYVVAGEADLRTAWPDMYRTATVLGGVGRFVLASGGQVASLVSPPGEGGTSFRAAAATADDPLRWFAAVDAQPGSWWADHLAWLAERSGPMRDAPPELGGRGMHAMAPAPGEYVLQP